MQVGAGPTSVVEGWATDRRVEMLRRHGPDSPNARVHAQLARVIRAAVHRIEQRLQTRALTSRRRRGPVLTVMS